MAIANNILIVGLILINCVGCSKEAPLPQITSEVTATLQQDSPKSQLSDSSKRLAEINGSIITENQLQLAIQNSLGPNAGSFLDQANQEKVLESLILGRVISTNAEQSLPKETILKIKLQTESYKEQLLIQHYLKNKLAKKIFNQEDITRYYQSHPEQFGQKKLHMFEALVVERSRDSIAYTSQLQKLEKLKNEKDWHQYEEKSIQYQTGIAEQILPKEIFNQLQDKPINTPATLTMANTTYLIKKTREQNLPPKPIETVIPEIKKYLLATQLREGIQNIGSKLAESSDIVRY
tara:strand:- start:125 stop:1003 length:879 start_codon:yes stop_codon:yes gene_type:complete